MPEARFTLWALALAKEKKNEEDFSNGYSIIDYGNKRIWDVWG